MGAGSWHLLSLIVCPLMEGVNTGINREGQEAVRGRGCIGRLKIRDQKYRIMSSLDSKFYLQGLSGSSI